MSRDRPSVPIVDERMVSLTLQLGVGGPGHTVRDALRAALSDPHLDLVYVRVGSGGWVDELGQPASTLSLDDDLAFTPIERDGSRVAGLIHDPALLDDPERLSAAAQVASLAIDNERLKAELRADLLEVQASRARIAVAGDAELRRLERNLHDGAQQRLVGSALLLRMAARQAAGDAVTTELLADAARELDDALAEIRDLTRRIQPAIVSDVGLGGALASLAERPGVPVELNVVLTDRLPEAIEVGAFYMVAEALTNTNKHADATRASVQATVVNDSLHVSVNDDGRGGAVPTPGSGLAGLADRVAALGGEFTINSPSGGGTTVAAHIPVTLAIVEDDRQRITAHKWIGWENWKAPAELYEQMTHDDNWTDSRLMLLLAGGNASLTARQREWIIGYFTTANAAGWVLEAIASYDDSDTLEELMLIPGVPMILRGAVYDALRMLGADGPLTPSELARIRQRAESTGVPADVVTELCDIVAAEQLLRDRRYELIVKPVLLG